MRVASSSSGMPVTAMARKAERKLVDMMAEASPLPATSATAISRLPSGCSTISR
jgi:hypothetical protein